MTQNIKKKNSAKAAFELIKPNLNKDTVLGIGTGSTTNFFIDQLNESDIDIKGAVCSSISSEESLNPSIRVISLNEVHLIDFYIDGADEFNDRFELIKGGGGAHTREKIVASASNEFICIVDESKIVTELGAFPLPVEVIPESRSLVSRKLISMGGIPEYRSGFVTDQGNHILDVRDIDISNPQSLELMINNIPGVVDNGIFAANKPQIILVPK